jgi:hypothetical protein
MLKPASLAESVIEFPRHFPAKKPFDLGVIADLILLIVLLY